MHQAAQGREAEPLDIRRERLEDAARDVLSAARSTGWFDPDILDVLPESPELQRAIASLLAAHALRLGPAISDPAPARLQRAWDAYLNVDSEAMVVDFDARETVIAEFAADPMTTAAQLVRVLTTRGHGGDCDDEPCSCWRRIARARLETMRGAA